MATKAYICSMARLNYPIGIQDFRKIREASYHYIDKTELIWALLTQGNYYFLSRPRCFGKSLLISTIKEIFRGRRSAGHYPHRNGIDLC